MLPACGSQRYEYNTLSKEWELTDMEVLSPELKAKSRKVLEEIIASGYFDIPPNPVGEIIEDRLTQMSMSALGQQAPIDRKSAWDPDQKKRQKIKTEIEARIPEVTVDIGGTTSLNILPKGFTKAVGLDRLLRKLELQKSDILFVGDAIYPDGTDYSPFEAGIESVNVDGPAEAARLINNILNS